MINDVILQLFKDSDSFILTKGLQKIKRSLKSFILISQDCLLFLQVRTASSLEGIFQGKVDKIIALLDGWGFCKIDSLLMVFQCNVLYFISWSFRNTQMIICVNNNINLPLEFFYLGKSVKFCTL